MAKPLKLYEKPSVPHDHKLPCAFRDLKPWQKTLWANRREYLIVHHAWTPKDAETEATAFLAREIYLTTERAKSKAAQMPLFEVKPTGDQHGVADFRRKGTR